MIAGSEVLNALQTGTVDGLDNAVFNYTNQGVWMSSPTSPNSTTATPAAASSQALPSGKS